MASTRHVPSKHLSHLQESAKMKAVVTALALLGFVAASTLPFVAHAQPKQEQTTTKKKKAKKSVKKTSKKTSKKKSTKPAQTA
jgi:prophage tail gpP-like protein